jgi:transcription elongation factor Elf1
MASEVTTPMNHTFHCPDCGREHDEPAGAEFVLAVSCADCELEALLEARRRETSRRAPMPTAA